MRIRKPAPASTKTASDQETQQPASLRSQHLQRRLSPQQVLQLQRTRGNRATQAIIQRRQVINDDVTINGFLKVGGVSAENDLSAHNIWASGNLSANATMNANSVRAQQSQVQGAASVGGNLSVGGKVFGAGGVVDGAQATQIAVGQVAKDLGIDEG